MLIIHTFGSHTEGIFLVFWQCVSLSVSGPIGRCADGCGIQTVPCKRNDQLSNDMGGEHDPDNHGEVRLYERCTTGYNRREGVAAEEFATTTRAPQSVAAVADAVAVGAAVAVAAAQPVTHALSCVDFLSGTSRWPSAATVVALVNGKRFSDWHRVIRRRRNRARETQTISHCYQMRP